MVLWELNLLQNNPNTIPWSVASKTDNVVDSVNYNSSDQGIKSKDDVFFSA